MKWLFKTVGALVFWMMFAIICMDMTHTVPETLAWLARWGENINWTVRVVVLIVGVGFWFFPDFLRE